MPNIQIKDVPEDTHAVLRQRASAAHQSLQEYLRSRLIAEAAQPTVDEVLARAGGRAGCRGASGRRFRRTCGAYSRDDPSTPVAPPAGRPFRLRTDCIVDKTIGPWG